MINMEALLAALASFQSGRPFHHCVIEDFFERDIARKLSAQFPPYDDPRWFHYRNPVEDKKALNDWNAFPDLTYKVFSLLNSRVFVSVVEAVVGAPLYPDHGLHGGGWHIHAAGGNLNPHMDYSIHPKLSLQRRLNIIIYLSEEMIEDYGGHLGLWNHDEGASRPGALAKEVAPRFNTAILFDTTQHSWHGMSRPLTSPANVFRKSLAIYYMCDPAAGADPRGRALFAAREEQRGDKEVERIIKLRSSVLESKDVYRIE